MKKAYDNLMDEIKSYKNKPLEFLSLLLSVFTTIVNIFISVVTYFKASSPLAFFLILLSLLFLAALINIKREKRKSQIMSRMIVDGNLRPSLMGYIKTSHDRKKEYYNSLKIWEANITYNFNQIDERTLHTQVNWNFQGRNEEKSFHLFRLLTNMNSDGNFRNIVIEAKDNVKNRVIPIIKELEPQTYQRYYAANFNPEIQHKEKYNFTISLKWDEYSSMFQHGDLYIIDPLNYSKEVEKISIFLSSQLNIQYSINAALLEINRDNFEYQIIQVGKINGSKKEKIFVFEPRPSKIYVMKLIADD